jgi:hypothetical protein
MRLFLEYSNLKQTIQACKQMAQIGASSPRTIVVKKAVRNMFLVICLLARQTHPMHTPSHIH